MVMERAEKLLFLQDPCNMVNEDFGVGGIGDL